MKTLIMTMLAGTLAAHGQWIFRGSNVAATATLTQSSEVSSAAYATDDNTNTFFMTSLEQHAWLELSFADTNWIDRLHLRPRPGAQYFGTNFIVFVSNLPFTSASTNVAFDPDVQTRRHSSVGPQNPIYVLRLGKHVRIQLAGEGELAIGEVTVMGYRYDGPVISMEHRQNTIQGPNGRSTNYQDWLLVHGLPNVTWLIEQKARLEDTWSTLAETRATNYEHRWRGPVMITNSPANFYRTREKLALP